jgi:hypothetical protein
MEAGAGSSTSRRFQVDWFPSINAVISLAKAQSTLRQAINMLLKQLFNTLRALRLCESQLFMDRYWVLVWGDQ